MTVRSIKIDEDTYTALLNACAIANHAVEEDLHPGDMTDEYPAGSSPFSEPYTLLGAAWSAGRPL